MDSSQAKEKNAPPGESEKKSADSFASDIFAAGRIEENHAPETAPEIETEKPPTWTRNLSKAARPAIDWNELKRHLPPDFSADLPRMLGESFAKYLNFAEENPVEFLFLIERETNAIEAATDKSWWLNIGIETREAEFAVEIDDVFAVWLIDSMIGGKSDNALIREFTPSEIAVLEFLALNLTHEANKIINAPLFKFHGLSRKIPAWTNQINNAENSILVANWQTVHGFLNSIVKVYVAPKTLTALNAEENKLLTAAPRRQTIRNSLQNRITDVRARLFLGEAQMTLADVAGLEAGDVILPENYNFSVSDGLQGRTKILLGDGEQSVIGGAFVPPDDESIVEFEEKSSGDNNEILVRPVKSKHDLRFVVEHFEELHNPQLLEKSMSNEEVETTENAAEYGESGIALENLAVTLRVELEARRLSLVEVGSLRINQIIELGISAAEPVNLLIDNKTVARGELVEVEDRLGVRIVQILR